MSNKSNNYETALEPLKPKYETFIRAYIENAGNASQAALTAGYSPKWAYNTGNAILKRPEVKARLAEINYKLEKNLEITIQWKIDKLKEVIDRGLSGRGLRGNYSNLSSVIHAIAELNRMQGHYLQTETLDRVDEEEVKRLVSKYRQAS